MFNEDKAGEFVAVRWLDLDSKEWTGWHLVRGDEDDTLCGDRINISDWELSNYLWLVDCTECNEAKGE